MPKVSVIIPVYNVEQYVERCLTSVLNQTLQDIEIIIVDDETPDRSMEICERYAAEDSRIRIHHQTNRGLGLSRNSGIELSTGTYLAFLDSDDYLAPNALQRLYTLAEDHDLDIVKAALNRFVIEDQFSYICTDSPLEIYTDPEQLKHIALCYFSCPGGEADRRLNLDGSSCGSLYRRSLLADNNIRFLSERQYISEDYIYNYHCARAARRVGKIHDTLYHYRVNPKSLSRTPRKDCLQRSVAYSRYLESMFLTDGYPASSELYAMGYTFDIMRGHIRNIMLSPMPEVEKRQWVAQESQEPYFERIRSCYPIGNVPLKHRLVFKAFIARRYRWLKLLLVGREVVRSILKK